MSSNEVRATCGDCRTELKPSDKQCPKCGSNKVIFHKSVGGNTLRPQGSLLARKKQKGSSKFVVEVVKGWFPSRNLKLTDGIHKERIVDREQNQYDEVVKDAKTGEILHEEHQRLSEHTKQGSNQRRAAHKLLKFAKRLGIGIIIGVVVGIVLLVVGEPIKSFISNFFNKPLEPDIVSSPSPNPIINYANIADVVISVTPDFKPPYVREFTETIPNDNPYNCSMVLEFKASDGFKFLPIKNLPENFKVDAGYEYKDRMRVYIKDVPFGFAPKLTLSVYTLTPDTYGGTENISKTVLEVHRQ